ncbi:Erg28 protein [Pseudovirgaria hyperparasitica]|uniref:Erg28 protein n=1 Tax=Pseudovirgaria hyperparasitica TaxID=470096 RepID=A0A6A6WLE6_9PEZI|nr:Erg28 protein [Pseudovirgaria hyperparasitica]KAF2763034.1 Erg28 protein [Pseudovirgaria hyperparasitica]
MEHVSSYLPPFQGLLPKWLLLVAVTSIGNSIQSYSTLKFTKRVYSGVSPTPTNPTASPVTPLSARTFGTWTFITSLVRLYAAYHITEPAIYELALWSFVVAFGHFASEWLVYGTTRWGAGLAGPVCVSVGSMVWMVSVWGDYVK